MTAAIHPATPTPALVGRYDRPGPRYTSYPPVPAWTQPFGADDYRAALREASEDAGDVAVYLHLPFCAQRCLYCGCNVSITRRAEKVDAYLDRLEMEIRRVTDVLGAHKRVTQVHLGGGTPNLLTEPQLLELHRMLERYFTIAPDCEKSLEADPRHVSFPQLQWLYALGFRRLSYGVQDLDPEVQRAIGRVQPVSLVREAVAMARDVGFTGLNVDLIYGLPYQTSTSVASTVHEVLGWGPDRVAVFGYAHVPWLRKHQRAIGESALPAAWEKFSLFRQTAESFEQAGYEWIGLDHFAKPGDSLATARRTGHLRRNFMGYTTVPAAHLLGFGMSAIGDVAGRFVQMESELPAWAQATDAGDLAVQRGHVQSPDDQWRRGLIERVMCYRDVPFAMMGDAAPAFVERLQPMIDDGLVELGPEGIAVTPAGRYFLRNVAMVFDATTAAAPPAGGYSRTV